MDVAKVMRGEADTSSIFPNSTDRGMGREQVYVEFLRKHAPSKCNVFLGGFLFGIDGKESGQLDVIVTTDTTPRFNLDKDGSGKSFSPVEGTLGVASIKSNLDKKELDDALRGISAIPATEPLTGRTNPLIKINNYEDWPLKIIYASNGISMENCLKHLSNFYLENPEIPLIRRPNIIHVSGKYAIFRIIDQMSIWDRNTQSKIKPDAGEFRPITSDSDLQGIIWTLADLQEKSNISNHIFYKYGEIINRINGIPID